MRIDYKGLNSYVVAPDFIEHAQPRLEGLEQFSTKVRDVRVAIELQRGRYTVEITCDADGLVLRSETIENDLLSAFDAGLEKVERRLNRHKSKLLRRRRQGPHRGEEPNAAVVEAPAKDPDDEQEGLEEFNIVRTKSHSLKPMSPQEAVLQMELVSHDFYVFIDDATEQVAVVYKRNDGHYGLIAPTSED